jgi:hypothetical protein
MKSIITIALLLTFTNAFAASKVRFVKPANNEVVAQTFDVEFAVEGMTEAKAGELKEGTGHHHIIIDGKAVAKGEVIKKDDTHKHFGDASTKTQLTLKPGKHTLTLQFADGVHKSYGEEYSSTITVIVK